MSDAEKIALLRAALIAASKDAAEWFDECRAGWPQNLNSYKQTQAALKATE